MDDVGTVVGIEGVASDITVQKQAEEALRESEKRYHMLVDSAKEAIVVIQDGMLRFVNPTTMSLIGATEQELMSTPFPAFIHNEDRAMVVENYNKRSRGDRVPDRYIFRLLPKDGASRWVEISAVTIDWEGRSATLNFLTDVTERRQAEEALQESTDRFKQLAEIFPETIFEADLDGRITYVNDHGLASFGFDASDVTNGVYLSDLIAPSDMQMVQSRISERLKGRKGDYLEYQALRRNGRTFDALAYSVPIVKNGRPTGIRGFILDISQRKRMEETLQQTNAKLSILNNITRHDILNQMTSLNGFLELCKQRVKDPDLIPYLDRMSRAAGNVQRQIAFTKDYQDMGVKAPAWYSIGRQTNDAYTMLQPKGVTLEDTTNGVEVLADQLAEKIPYNLIDNSVHHGEHVTHIKLSAEQVGDAMLIVYEDDGMGISAMDKEHIFEKGFGKNTGLGLFFAREILDITGITIIERGITGQGARFEILVPPGGWRRPPP
jgi:PAS domain S-box-containing protein